VSEISAALGCAKSMQLINDHDGSACLAARAVDEGVLSPSCGREPIQARWAVHPFLFAAFPILYLFAQNASQVHVMDLARLLGFVLAGTLLLYFVLGLVMRNAPQAAFITSLAVLFFFTIDIAKQYADFLLSSASQAWVLHSFDIDLLWIVLPEIAVLALAAYALKKKWSARGMFTSFLNVFSAVLVAIPIVQAASIKAPTIGRPPHEPVPYPIAAQPDAAPLPDIYYIILDGYARTDVMKSFFDFDNAPFLKRLEEQGFYIARDSIANYCQTPLSLSASLNSVYLDDLVKGLGPDQTQLSDLIGNNNLMATLRPLGYKFVTFSTGFDPTEHPEADVYLSPHSFASGFERMVIDITPLRAVWPNPKAGRPTDMNRERTFYLLDHLADVARDRSPTFTFAHVFCPHPPFVFGEKGQDVSLRNKNYEAPGGDRLVGRFRDPAHFARAYRAQSAFITERIEAVIKEIIAQSPEPPIIILQSDHGSELKLDYNNVANTDLKERMSILNAYYFPGKKYQDLYRGISPVNSYRVVLNSYFGAKLPLLPDRSFFSTWTEPYRFIDVTEAVITRDAAPAPLDP
jgi:hypothetical protein